MGKDPPFTLTNEMMRLVKDIAAALGGIRGAEDLEKLPRLRKTGRIRSIHSSLAIENNSLTIEQVSDIIDGRRVIGPPKEILEVKNAFAAYKELENIDPFDIKDLLRTHKVMMNGLVEESGRFRSVDVGVFAGDGSVVHAAPGHSMVPGLMNDLFEWLNTSDADELIKSSVFHYEFEFIHPFRDGNGRMGRLWQTAILVNWMPVFAWIPVESIIRERQSDYYDAIASSTRAGSSNDFIVYMLKAILDAVNAVASDAERHISRISTRVRNLLKALGNDSASAAELMERLDLKSRKALYDNYLKPAIEAGLVSMTEPDKPTSRNQMYFRK
ncbi:MAG: Fic family protein [Methanomassiliicoccaceae archaeon]|nr:Fic family protein [Methanomassiliicoccaceae archaeon]